MPEPEHLHTLEPLTRFSDRAEDYARYRPSYPEEAIDALLKGLNAPSVLCAADIGAGTGIASRLLAERGVRVLAIEPNPAMRQAATPHPNVQFLPGAAEATGLADASVNLITSFQAFHWFEPVASLTEFHRILKPGGRLALVWNDRDQSDSFTEAYGQIIRAFGRSHPASRRSELVQPLATLSASGLFTDTYLLEFPYRQVLDFDALIGRVRSSSYLPLDGPERLQLLNELQTLYRRWADLEGRVYLLYRTRLYLAKRLP